MKDRKYIVDTTLRDGEQSPRIAFKQKDKIQIAQILDKIGVYEIEAGIPMMKVETNDFVEELKDVCTNAKISLWSRMNKKDVIQACEYKPDILHIGVPVSYVQIYGKLKKNKVWVQKTLSECIEIANKKNINLTIGFEDASRSDEGFLINTAKMIEKSGLKTLRIADTVGILTPKRTKELISKIISEVEMDIEYHGHNDLGMCLANSISALIAGAKYIDCTLLGIGERSGNCNLQELVESSKEIFDFSIENGLIKKAEELLIEKSKKLQNEFKKF